ncbi:hypothetical protein [Glaciibacter psychrotolerans]|uniref:Uncharacterized protein n=1 Tax=Glaciibacter psychrotolerans TaxID=670054 RepID=A0A7Z0ECX1_9MICO|nr:hypothetical protein [Leifsonia psychrotolerans]NYJ19168.1 hypothetical protein [Leifsonia psychrotolerans]
MTHGTPAQFAAGCINDTACLNHRTGLMTCREAAIRYRGDYAYRKQVDAGVASAEREVFARPAKPVKATVKRAKAAPTPRVTKGIIGPDGLVHGTTTGYKRCKPPTECPAIAAGLPSCAEAGREKARLMWRARKGTTSRPEAKHGTVSGYSTFKCRAGDVCPAIAETGKSCADAVADAARIRYHAQKGKA